MLDYYFGHDNVCDWYSLCVQDTHRDWRVYSGRRKRLHASETVLHIQSRGGSLYIALERLEADGGEVLLPIENLPDDWAINVNEMLERETLADDFLPVKPAKKGKNK